jgi:ketosteroid isomerase-like protein
MRMSFFKMVEAVSFRGQTCFRQGRPLTVPLLSFLKPLSAPLRLGDLYFRYCLAALFLLHAAQPARLPAQNIPPMIGDQVGKPKLRIPNPLESTQKGSSQTSQSSQSGQIAASATGEREVHSFLENWRSSLSKKDLEALSSCYLQTEALRVDWESQEFSGWEPFKAEMQRRFASPEGFQLELVEPQTNVFGRFAWVTAHYSRRTWTDATPKSQEGFITLVLEKRRSAWFILHQHASIAAASSPLNLSTK